VRGLRERAASARLTDETGVRGQSMCGVQRRRERVRDQEQRRTSVRADSGKCVQCVATSDCAGDADGGVDGGADGGVVAGFCDTKTNQCVGCLSSMDCTDPSKPICGTTQTCVACGSQLALVDGCATKNSTYQCA